MKTYNIKKQKIKIERVKHLLYWEGDKKINDFKIFFKLNNKVINYDYNFTLWNGKYKMSTI